MLKKGIFLVLLASLMTVYQINAQDDFSIGPRAGVNFSNVSNVDNSKSLTGLALGLTSTYSINETTGLTMDALYSKEGYQDGINDVKFSYLQIPLYFDVFFGDLGERFRPKVYAGIVPGFQLNAKVNDEVVDNDQFKTFNLALSGGLGFNYRAASRIWINTDLRSYLGLMDIRDQAGDDGGDKRALNNIQLSLGLAYGLTKYE